MMPLQKPDGREITPLASLNRATERGKDHFLKVGVAAR